MTASKSGAGGARAKGSASPPEIDRDKMRDALRIIGDEYVFYILDEAIDLLPPDELAKLVGQYIEFERLRPDAGASATKRSLLEEVKDFDNASRAKKYYVSFNVNSKNCMESSTGTRAFIAECRRQLDPCVAHASKGPAAETREAFDTIFALLRHIDEGNDDVVFVADEGGSWQVGVDWGKVVPAWFRCLSKSAEPSEFASAVVATVDGFEEYSRDAYFAAARKSRPRNSARRSTRLWPRLPRGAGEGLPVAFAARACAAREAQCGSRRPPEALEFFDLGDAC